MAARLGGPDRIRVQEPVRPRSRRAGPGGQGDPRGRGRAGRPALPGRRGLRNLQEMQRQLDREIEDLFKPGGSRPRGGLIRVGSFCAPWKGVGLQWVQFPPGNWVAPAGSYRSGGGGNETVGAFETNGSLRRFSEPTGRNASERRAGLETTNVGADPATGRGRPPSLGTGKRLE